MSRSVKPVASVLAPLVLWLVPLMALLSWARLISPGGPWTPMLPLLLWRPSFPRGRPKVKRRVLPAKSTLVFAGVLGGSVFVLST